MARKMIDEDWRALRFEVGQLFTPSTPVGVAELFAGRQDQIGKLLDAISERGRQRLKPVLRAGNEELVNFKLRHYPDDAALDGPIDATAELG